MSGRRPAARMQLVEVDEPTAPPRSGRHDNPVETLVAPAPGSAPRIPVGRLVRRLWPVALLAVVAVVAVVLVAVARDRAFVERMSSVPGLVRPLDGAPSVAWRAPASPHQPGGVVAAGDAIVLVSAQGDRWLVTAHHAADGTPRWSADLAQVQRSGFETSLVSCPSLGEDVGAVVLCLVTLPRVVYSDDASVDEPAHTRVVALDAARGTELGTWEVQDELLTASRVGDDLVVVTLDREGHAVAERRAGTTGEVRWTFTSPDVLESLTLARVAEAVVSRGVVVLEGFVTTVLDVDDGAVLATGAPYRNLQVVALEDGFATWATVGGGQVHAADGTERFGLDGLPASFALDDGSADDVLLVDDGSRLRGVATASGAPLWTTDTQLDVHIRVSDRLVVAGLTRFGVMDAADGRLRWVSDAGDPMPWDPLTDGALVLAPAVSPEGATQLVGLGLDDGVRYWALDLPGRVQRVDGFGGHLVARTASEAVVIR